MDKQPSADNIEPFLSEAVPTLEAESYSGEFYLPAGHIQLLEQLGHLSRYSHFIQVVTGVAGIGKTTLLEQFYPSSDDNSVHACCISPQQPMSAESLLYQIGQQLSLDISPSASLELQLQTLLEHAQLLKQLSRQLLIVVDDAHQLEADALELLLNQLANLEDDDLRPSIVLFASPAILQKLQTPGLAEMVTSSCHFSEIPPFSADELFALLEHSYKAINQRLDDSQRQQVYAAALGLPGRLPRVLEATLKGELDKNIATTENIDAADAKTARSSWPWIALTGAAIIATGAWFSWPLLESKFQGSMASSDGNRVRLELPVNQPADEASATPVEASELEQRLAQARAALEAEQPPQAETSPQPPSSEPTSGNQQLELAPVKQPPASLTALPSTDNKLALTLPLPSEDLATSDSSTPTTSTEPESRYYGDGSSLLKWNPDGYTLQMLGARQESSVIKFIAAMPERDNLRYFATLYKGKPWYVVVYQQYPNRDAAMNAIGALPPELRARRPWARSIHGVQDDIRRGAE